MRLAGTKSVAPGTILAQPIYSENGVILLQKGVELTESILNRLLHQGITYVYIDDEATNDIQVESVITDALRREAAKTIKDTFSNIKKEGLLHKSFILDRDGKKLRDMIKQIMEQIQSHEDSISLLTDIFLTDNYIFQHSLNVTIYALTIGASMNMNQRELAELGIGAVMHDIGKVFIEPDILQKPGNLTKDEYEIMKSHTNRGFEYLRKKSSFSSVVAHCAYQHHERLDGSGYPRGLKDKEIHKYAKIIGIADVFDALTSNRVYREAMLPHEGLEILYAGAVRLFDRNMVEAFKRSVAVYPNGLTVELSDGRTGIVVKQNKHVCDRPVVRIIQNEEKQRVAPYEVNLASQMNIMITKCNIT